MTSGYPYLSPGRALRSSSAMPGSVLVVDDDPAFRGLARRMLVAAGLTVVGEAETIESAGVAASELKPDAVLLDVMLPDGDGVALAGRLVALPWKPRVVLTSSDAGIATEEEIRRSGATAFVPKDELSGAPLEKLFLGS